ncbi:uncharacterized protein IUM83_11255 [Phytophthora cinnamomi]|uniref:uncharacterized protein n=1 Tax=Phytophthora cinnamomi TaxID=4785 RepID=UPI0035594573|nr:hypothetical protein IUM83_11255 [Phytophthora cinnamomi]
MYETIATFLVDRDVVGNLLCGLEGCAGDDTALQIFKRQSMEINSEDVELELGLDENDARYAVTVETKVQLERCVEFLTSGVSFKQETQLLLKGVMSHARVSTLCSRNAYGLALDGESRIVRLCA